MLWNSVFEFFIKYVFGGTLGNQIYGTILGTLFSEGAWNDTTTNSMIAFKFFDRLNQTYYMPLGNYLSLIATIITMVIIVVLCCLFVKKIVSLVGGLIRQ